VTARAAGRAAQRVTAGVCAALAAGLGLLVTGGGLAEAAPPGAHQARWDPGTPVTPARLSDAKSQADQLRARLDELTAREDRAQERLGYVRDQLAAASNASIGTEQELEVLLGDASTTAATEVNRIRALYMTGGAPALYSTVLGGTDISDVLSRVATVRQVMTADAAHRSDAAAAVRRTSDLHERLATVAQTRAQLAGRASALLATVQGLQQAQRQALRAANTQVKQLADALAAQREQAARDAAARSLGSLGLLDGPRPAAGNPYGDAAIAAALSKLGRPYVWGAEGPDTFDCSGLVQWSYAQAGLSLPRLADDQYFAATPVPLSDLKPGDLLVYAYDVHDASTIHHITMYLGNGQMVHAPHTGDVVRVAPVYLDGLYGAARPGLS
jgi:cell wall-associated NlpC family hydrolase